MPHPALSCRDPGHRTISKEFHNPDRHTRKISGAAGTLMGMMILSACPPYPFIDPCISSLMEISENLRIFLESAEDWERKATTISGVSIIRLPATRNRQASLAIEVNPLDANGRPMKKKGIMVMGREEVTAFAEIFTSDKLMTLIDAMEAVTPEKKMQKKGQRDVLEI
jgi:hypothetical protein